MCLRLGPVGGAHLHGELLWEGEVLPLCCLLREETRPISAALNDELKLMVAPG